MRAMRFGVQMRYLVEIEILVFSDLYMSLKYACEILVQYLEPFLRYRQKFIDSYIIVRKQKRENGRNSGSWLYA